VIDGTHSTNDTLPVSTVTASQAVEARASFPHF